MTGTDDRTTKLTLPSDVEMVMTRVFDAPRARVFEAWTRPELLRRWWGPPGWTLPTAEVDLRVGGAWRFVMRNERGKEMILHGVYREIIPGKRLVYTQLMEGCEGLGDAEAVSTIEFTESAGKTTLVCRDRYPSKEVRDSVLDSGAADIDAVYDRLDEVLLG